MFRPLLVCALLLALLSTSRADDPKRDAGLIRMTLTPMPAPKPALKYQLLPELREMNPGNPILGYLKCFMEQNHFFHSKEAAEQRDKWTEMPLKDLPVKKLRDYGGVALRQADYAARLDTVDWQTLLKLRSDGIHLLVPEIQQLRMLTQALTVRFRGAVADRRFDDALTTAKTLFAMARHLGEHPTMIGDLVGNAVASIALGTLDEMIQQPGCPNLYWALTDLPTPLIDLRKGLQGERLMLANEFALLDETAPMSAEGLRKAVAKVRELIGVAGARQLPIENGDLEKWLKDRLGDEAYIRAARGRLAEAGLSAAMVKQFPALQVVLLDERREYEARRDDAMKGMLLPYWQLEPLLATAAFKKAGSQETLFAWLVPAVVKVREAKARLEQRIGLLRHVEALRLYAAAHDGKLPARLADVKVPLPVDPFTGRAFLYELKDATATVRGSPPRGREKAPWYNVRYVLTIRK